MYPRRMGGGKPTAVLLAESLAAARGTALAASNPTTAVYVETVAIARAIAAAWATNERLGHQWDARRMTDMLPRWEKIYGLSPSPDDSLNARRLAVEKAQQRVGQAAIPANVQQALIDALGDVFVALEYLTPTAATIHVPDGTYPFGTVAAGFPWYSTVARVFVLVVQPDEQPDRDFYAAVGRVVEILDPLLPAYMTFDWYRAPQVGAPISILGGPTRAGFYLDERNVNESIFDA
jgi:uncharacterized protein YmfQ (DUF2313 family)